MESEDTQWISMCSVIRAQKTIFLNVVEEKEKNEWYGRDKKERRSKDIHKEMMKLVEKRINHEKIKLKIKFKKMNEIKGAKICDLEVNLNLI